MMKLHLVRLSSQFDDTLGALYIDGNFACFTIEDEWRSIKVRAETRIPAGTYEIKLRKEGGFHQRYSSRFNDIHRGMLELQDVSNFTYILIHCGNDDDDTNGCILVGDSAQQNITKDGFVGESTAAYRRIYPRIASALLAGEQVTIDVEDYDNGA